MNKQLLALLIICGMFVSSSYAQDKQSTDEEPVYSLKGIYNITDFGLLVGSSRNDQKAPFAFMNVISYQLTEQFAVGMGFGTDFYEETYIPIVIDVRYYLRDTKFSPFAYIQMGHSIAAEGNISQPVFNQFRDIWPGPVMEDVDPKGGFLINPGLGVRNMFNKHFGLIFSVGYRFQKLDYELNPRSKVQVEYNRLNIKFGIIFR